MAYLALKRIVHRDLATRNVLVDVDWKCKVGLLIGCWQQVVLNQRSPIAPYTTACSDAT